MLAIFTLSGGEILLILATSLLFWGGRRLPQLAKGFRQSIREFKKAVREGDENITTADSDKIPSPTGQARTALGAAPGGIALGESSAEARKSYRP